MKPAKNGGALFGDIYLPPNVKATLAGIPVEIGSSSVVIDGKTFGLSSPMTLIPNIAGSAMTVLHGGDVAIGSKTIHAGSLAVTVSGTVISALPSNGGIVIDGKTFPVSQLSPQPTPPPLLDGHKITIIPAGGVAIDGKILSPGGSQIIVDGTTMSLMIDGDRLIIGTQKLFIKEHIPVSTAAAVSDSALASMILAAFHDDHNNSRAVEPTSSMLQLQKLLLPYPPSLILRWANLPPLQRPLMVILFICLMHWP